MVIMGGSNRYESIEVTIDIVIDKLSYVTPFVAKFKYWFIQYSMQIQCIQFNDSRY